LIVVRSSCLNVLDSYEFRDLARSAMDASASDGRERGFAFSDDGSTRIFVEGSHSISMPILEDDCGYFHSHVIHESDREKFRGTGVSPEEFYSLPSIPADLDLRGDVPEKIVCIGIAGRRTVSCYIARPDVDPSDIARWREESKRYMSDYRVRRDMVDDYYRWKSGIIRRFYDVRTISVY